MRKLGVVGKIILGSLVAVFLLALVFVAWWIFSIPQQQNPQPSPSRLLSGQEDWQRIYQSGKLVVGISPDFPPLVVYRFPQGMVGIEPELARKLASELGLTVEFKHLANDGLGSALAVGQVDVVISAFSPTAALRSLVDYSQPYYYQPGQVLARPGAPFRELETIEDLAAFRIGVEAGSIQQSFLRRKLIDKGRMNPANLLPFEQAEAARSALLEGKIDLLWIGQESVERYGKDLSIVNAKGLPVEFVVVVPKDSLVLLGRINQAIQVLRSNGQLKELASSFDQSTDSGPFLATPVPELVPAATSLPPPPPACIASMAIEEELSLPLGLNMELPKVLPGQVFLKGWRIVNTGTCPWTGSYSLRYAYGNSPASRMNGQPTPLRNQVLPGGSIDIYINLTAPTQAGQYIGFWQLENVTSQSFGERLFVGIEVDPNAPHATPTPDSQPNASPTSGPSSTQNAPTGLPGLVFFVDRSSIYPGQAVTFLWSVSNARQVYFFQLGEDFLAHPVSNEGIQTIYPQRSAMFELRVILADGSTTSQQIWIEVLPGLLATDTPSAEMPVILFFEITPTEINRGECTILSWKTGGGSEIVKLYRNGNLVLEDAPLEGTAQDCVPGAGQVEYSLSASNISGQFVEAFALLLVK